MTVSHRLTGYSRITERLALAYEIPLPKNYLVQTVARIDPGDPDAIGVYVLHDDQARDIGRILGEVINTDLYDWCLEPMPHPLQPTV